jgi:hypothetical protein
MYVSAKMISVETVLGIKGGWWKRAVEGGEREQWRVWIQVWYIWYIVRTCVNAAMYPYPAQQ